MRSHIHEPNAPELLHFLFTPFMVILDACQWGLGRNIASQVVSPLITREATNLLQHSLSSKEYEVWMSLGEAWKTPALVKFLSIFAAISKRLYWLYKTLQTNDRLTDKIDLVRRCDVKH